MGRGSSKVGGGSSSVSSGGNSGISTNTPTNVQSLTKAEAQMLKNQYESGFDAATQKSIQKYISADDFTKGFSLSQTMNYAINQGIDLQDPNLTVQQLNRQLGLNLTQNQFLQLQKTDANIDAAMHPIGQSVNLQRGCHMGDLERNFGIKNYDQMSEQQLQSLLVGATFQNAAVMSTSYDVKGNPFLGSGPASGGREIVYNIKAGAKTPMVWGAMNQNEAVLGKGINWKITGVRFTGKTAFPRTLGKSIPQLELDIETY